MKMLYVVAHGIDVDGFACHAIIERYARENDIATEHYFVHHQDQGDDVITVIDALEKISSKLIDGDKILIADIGYNEALLNHFLETYSKPLFKNSVSWCDHHKWPESVKNEVGYIADEFIVDIDLCASQIVQNRFLAEDMYAKEIGKCARQHDMIDGKITDQESYNLASILQDVITSGHDKMDIVKTLADGEFPNSDFKSISQDYRTRIRPCAIEKMDHTITEYAMEKNDLVAKITMALVPEFLDSKDVRAYLMDSEKKKKEPDAIIAIWENGRIAYEIQDEKHRFIIDKINTNYGGGGRGFVGGAKYDGSVDKIHYKQCFDEIMNVIKV
ncbi:MAG: hypothetical protein U9O53_05370 [archaeon]|nr:hypothetical protein [archaeon]